MAPADGQQDSVDRGQHIGRLEWVRGGQFALAVGGAADTAKEVNFLAGAKKKPGFLEKPGFYGLRLCGGTRRLKPELQLTQQLLDRRAVVVDRDGTAGAVDE